MSNLQETDLYLVVLDPTVNSPPPHPVPDQTIREICHDLRQPLATIRALAEAASTIPDIPDAVRQRLQQVLDETTRMSDLTRRLLGESLALAPLDAGTIAREVAGSAAVTFEGSIEVTAEPGIRLVADEPSLRRALANLVENATRAAGPGGTVSVSVRRSGDSVTYEVSDSGPGFGAGPRGTGSLGLAIVERVVQTHRGRLEISNSSLGGAQVRLSIPAPPAPRSRKPPARTLSASR